jgi:hypothetical protein
MDRPGAAACLNAAAAEAMLLQGGRPPAGRSAVAFPEPGPCGVPFSDEERSLYVLADLGARQSAESTPDALHPCEAVRRRLAELLDLIVKR